MDEEDRELIRGKVEQAATAIADAGLDCWLVFCRETGEIPEPALPLIAGTDVVWETAAMLTPDGEHHVVVGRYDAAPFEELGVYEIHTYDESIEESLREVLAEIDPGRIGLDYSTEEVAADGLTHGLYRRLTSLLDGTPYPDRFESAAPVVTSLRSAKNDVERDRMHRAATLTESLLAEAVEQWDPEMTEAHIAEYLHDRMREEGLDSAWGWDHCPAVDAGADAPVGHSTPGDRRLPPGEVLHFDFGVKYRDYAADIQRLYYRPDGDGGPPQALREAIVDVRAAIEAAKEKLEPGVQGYVVDEAAREEITGRGWPAFEHAAGHTVGRNAHDAGTLLGPRWERYGSRPEGRVEAGEIYTLELGVATEWGYLGLEELLEVTVDGATYFLEPQRELRILAE